MSDDVLDVLITDHLDGWTVDTELLAASVEVTHAVVRSVLAAGGSKRVPDPLVVPRPERLQSKPRTFTMRQVAERMMANA